MSHKPGDMVRIVKDDPNKNNRSSMIRSFRGADAKVVEARDDGMYRVEIDMPLAIGGAPQFIVRPVMIGPDVTPAMLRAARRAGRNDSIIDDNPGPEMDDFLTMIYRAMRAARFEP